MLFSAITDRRHKSTPTPPVDSGVSRRDLSGPIGSVLHGLNLNDQLTSTQFDDLRSLVAERHVVFITGQGTEEGPIRRIAERFGTLSTHPLQEMIGRTQTVSIIEDTPSRPPAGFPWHTDLSWLESPPRFGFLQALDIPDKGGDTMWTSMPAAYSSLSPAFQSLLTGMTAVHRIDPSFRQSVVRHHGAEVASDLESQHPPVSHPLVRMHPDTGEPSLFLSPLYMTHIEDLHPDESTLLMGHLDRVIDNPNLSVRWHWQPGDIAIWDESCTVHRALIDHHPSDRRMRRCTVAGDRIEAFLG